MKRVSILLMIFCCFLSLTSCKDNKLKNQLSNSAWGTSYYNPYTESSITIYWYFDPNGEFEEIYLTDLEYESKADRIWNSSEMALLGTSSSNVSVIARIEGRWDVKHGNLDMSYNLSTLNVKTDPSNQSTKEIRLAARSQLSENYQNLNLAREVGAVNPILLLSNSQMTIASSDLGELNFTCKDSYYDECWQYFSKAETPPPPEPEEDASSAVEEEMVNSGTPEPDGSVLNEERINWLIEQIPDHKTVTRLNNHAFSNEMCGVFQAAVKKDQVDRAQGYIGLENLEMWYNGQDGYVSSHSINNIKQEGVSGSAKIEMHYSFSEDQVNTETHSFTMKLKLENGRWVIDDWIDKRRDGRYASQKTCLKQ